MELRIRSIIIISLFIMIGFCSKAQDQDTTLSSLPSFRLKDLNGKTINTAEIDNKGKPILVVFWKTCCKPPVNMLDAIAEVYEDWVEETGVILFAVSIDDTRSTKFVAPFVNGRGWDYEVLLDPNSGFKRAMNVVITPHTFLLNGDGEIVWQKAMYVAGDEEEILKQIKKIRND